MLAKGLFFSKLRLPSSSFTERIVPPFTMPTSDEVGVARAHRDAVGNGRVEAALHPVIRVELEGGGGAGAREGEGEDEGLQQRAKLGFHGAFLLEALLFVIR